jgi:hypothetical protein
VKRPKVRRIGARTSARQSQRGYLVEIPILLAIVLVVLAVLVPRLPPVGQKATIGAGAVAILCLLFYMVIVPGWMPGKSAGRALAWRVPLYVGSAALILIAAGWFILS